MSCCGLPNCPRVPPFADGKEEHPQTKDNLVGRKILKKSFTCGSPGIGSTEGLGVVKAGSKEVDSQVLGTKGSTRCGLLIHPSPSCKLRKTRPSNAYGRNIPNRELLSESRFEPRRPFMPLSMM